MGDQPSNDGAEKAEQPQQQIPVTQEVIFNYSNTNDLANISTSALHKSRMSFQAGQVRHFIKNWAILTSDPFILNAVKHYHIEFEGDFPIQTQRPYQIRFSAEETQIIDSEILKYSSKRVIEPACVTPESFVSTIFIRPKKDGSHRMILNLKPFNEFVDYNHFKMDTFQTDMKLNRPGCFMASIDLKDAYYSIPVADEDRKFLMFEWKGTFYQFTCLPNGLSCAPRVFTKNLKGCVLSFERFRTHLYGSH